jgi:hypothetical protein
VGLDVKSVLKAPIQPHMAQHRPAPALHAVLELMLFLTAGLHVFSAIPALMPIRQVGIYFVRRVPKGPIPQWMEEANALNAPPGPTHFSKGKRHASAATRVPTLPQ